MEKGEPVKKTAQSERHQLGKEKWARRGISASRQSVQTREGPGCLPLPGVMQVGIQQQYTCRRRELGGAETQVRRTLRRRLAAKKSTELEGVMADREGEQVGGRDMIYWWPIGWGLVGSPVA